MVDAYLSAADDQNRLVADLPSENEGSTALDFGELGGAHVCFGR
jgi:hypothetical protein